MTQCKAALQWKTPDQEKPPQGKKILCLHKGDVYVAQRTGDYYFSLPFYDSIFSRYFVPEKWADINLPDGLTGMIYIELDGKRLNLDELEEINPDAHRCLMLAQKEIFDKHGGEGNAKL